MRFVYLWERKTPRHMWRRTGGCKHEHYPRYVDVFKPYALRDYASPNNPWPQAQLAVTFSDDEPMDTPESLPASHGPEQGLTILIDKGDQT